MTAAPSRLQSQARVKAVCGEVSSSTRVPDSALPARTVDGTVGHKRPSPCPSAASSYDGRVRNTPAPECLCEPGASQWSQPGSKRHARTCAPLLACSSLPDGEGHETSVAAGSLDVRPLYQRRLGTAKVIPTTGDSARMILAGHTSVTYSAKQHAAELPLTAGAPSAHEPQHAHTPQPCLPGASPLTAGGYARPWERSTAASLEHASFTWPLTTIAEVRRLLSSHHLRPTWLMLGDASATWTCQMETTHGITALVVDRRSLDSPCLGYRGEFADIIPLARWDGICAWPSCTHQAVSNSSLLSVKEQDGRMFFGILGVLIALLGGEAQVRMVEQPVTTMGRYFPWPTHRLRTSAFGDTMSKTICLRMVGMDLVDTVSFHRDPVGPLQARLPVWAFASDEERTRSATSIAARGPISPSSL
jgi:hypothetical protein